MKVLDEYILVVMFVLSLKIIHFSCKRKPKATFQMKRLVLSSGSSTLILQFIFYLFLFFAKFRESSERNATSPRHAIKQEIKLYHPTGKNN